jgi:hypothetical protein
MDFLGMPRWAVFAKWLGLGTTPPGNPPSTRAQSTSISTAAAIRPDVEQLRGFCKTPDVASKTSDIPSKTPDVLPEPPDVNYKRSESAFITADINADTTADIRSTAELPAERGTIVAGTKEIIDPALRGSGCVVMYDDRISLASEKWFRKWRNGRSDGKVSILEMAGAAKRDQPFDWNISSIAILQVNKLYADRHGYDFWFESRYAPYDIDYPPYWVKVKMMRDALYRTKRTVDGTRFAYECLIWLDTDACVDITSQPASLQDLFQNSSPQTCFLFSPNQPEWEGYFCAGVFVAKNTQIAREFFDQWLSMYDPSAWSIQDSIWTCTGEWAGEKYEQGTGIALVQHSKYREYVQQKPWYFFNNHNYAHTGRGFSMHFAGRYKLYIEPYLHLKTETAAQTAAIVNPKNGTNEAEMQAKGSHPN